MSRKNFITLALAACVLVAFTWQRRSLAQLRQQNETLLQTKEEAVRLALENEELPKLRAGSNSDQTGVASTDLLRLRNEARQLRAQLPELGRLRAENGRLAAEISSGIAAPQKLSEMEGFVAKESWSNAGFDTPEATVQTFFWAIREGDLARIAECMPAKDRQYLLRLTEEGHEQEREKTLSEFQGLTQASGFRIVNRAEEQGLVTRAGQSITEGTPVPARVTLGLQAAAGGAVIPLQLSREPDGWKLKGFL
jgi:hypothetical protein